MTDQPPRPEYLPAEVLDWADEHHDLLELVVQRLLESGEWPLVGELTRSLAREGRPSPLSELLQGMPKPLGFVESQPRRIVLLLFGLLLTGSGQPLLDGFATVLRAAVERFQGDAEHPLITSSDLPGHGSPQQPYVQALSEILLREAPFLGSGSGGPGEDWSREVTEDVVRYWNVTSAEDYVRIRAHELFAATLPGWPRLDLSPGSANTETANSATDAETSPLEEIRDAFISHASEDKASVARPLVDLLVKLGHSVWFDEQELVVGSHLSESIDRGLAQSRFGVVILSHAFFAKQWTKRELEGLVAREMIDDERLILPIWHEIDADDVAHFSPPLAAVLAARTSEGLQAVAESISQAINKRGHGPAIPAQPSPGPSLSVEVRQKKDAEVFHAITTALRRDDISYFAEHDFGSPWSRDRTRSLHRLVEEHNAVEDCFLDPELEKLRKDLFDATDALRWSSAKHGVLSGNVHNHFELIGNDWVRNNPPEGLRYEQYEAHRRELGELGDRMVSAYDRLVAAARARLPDA